MTKKFNVTILIFSITLIFMAMMSGCNNLETKDKKKKKGKIEAKDLVLPEAMMSLHNYRDEYQEWLKFNYDNEGKITCIFDDCIQLDDETLPSRTVSEINYYYDEDGNLTKSKEKFALDIKPSDNIEDNNPLVRTYLYDGNKVTVKLSREMGDMAETSTVITLNDKKQAVRVENYLDAYYKELKLDYDDNGNISKLTLVDTNDNVIEKEYTYNLAKKSAFHDVNMPQWFYFSDQLFYSSFRTHLYMKNAIRDSKVHNTKHEQKTSGNSKYISSYELENEYLTHSVENSQTPYSYAFSYLDCDLETEEGEL